MGLGLFPQEPVRRMAEARLREASGAGSRLGNLRVTPFLLRAEVGDLQLEGDGYALSVPRARVVLSPRALAGALAVRRLEVEAPVLRLTAGEDVLEEKDETPLPVVEIESLAVSRASVHWSSPTSTLRIEDLSAEGAIGSGTLTIEAPRGMWDGAQTIELGAARARLAVSRGLDVTVESLEAHAAGSRLGARGRLARRGQADLALDVEARLDVEAAGRAFGQPEVSGSLDLDGRLEGPLEDLAVALDARGAVGWEGLALDGLRVRLRGHPAESRGEARVEGTLLGGTLEVEARLGDGTTTGSLLARGLDLARLPEPWRPPGPVAGDALDLTWEGPVGGPLDVEVATRVRGRHEDVVGRLDMRALGQVEPRTGEADLEWTAALHADASSPAPATLDGEGRGRVRGAWPLELTGTLTGTVAAPERPAWTTRFSGDVRARGGEVEARFTVSGPLDLTGELQARGDRIETLSLVATDIDLATLHPDASGRARFEGQASGPMRNPDLSVRISASDLGWAGAGLGRLEGGAEGTAERVELRAALPDLSVGLEGALTTTPHPRLQGRAEIKEVALAPLAPALGITEPLAGRLTADLAFDLPLDRPAEAEATLDVAALEAEYGDRALLVQPFRAELREGRLAVRDVRVKGPGVSLDVSASAGLEHDAPLDVRAWLEADLGVLPVPEGWSVTGSLSGAVGLAGTRDRPALDGALHAADLVVRGPEVPEVDVADVELFLKEDRLTVPPFVARVGTGRATLAGDVPYAAAWAALRDGDLTATQRARLTASWEDIAVGPFEGGLAGDLTLEGGLASLDEPEGTLRFPARRLAFEGLTLEVQPGVLRLAGGRVTTEGLTVRSGQGDLVVTGSADVVGDTLDVRARGGFSLGLLSPLLPEASVGGSAEVDLAVSGPFGHPVPHGTVTVDGVSLRMRALPQAVTGVRGRVALEGSTAVLDATGEVGGGPLRLEGEAQVEGAGLGELWLQLTGRDVALRYPPGLRSRLDVDLTLAGRPGDLSLAGDVDVQGGVYELDTAVRQALGAPAPAAAGSDLLRDVALDVTVDLARPVVVQSSFGRLEATGRVTARGDLLEPAPFGRLDVRRGGRLEIQGREMTVTGGSLAYSGTWSADLSLSGETVVPSVEFNDGSTRDVRVRASLQGSMDQPSLDLSSDPSLSRQEIVSVIATGRTSSSLVDSSAWLLGGQAASLVSGQLTNRVAQTFGLDEITVRPDLVAQETDPSARFTFGKRIGQPLAVVYSAGLGGPETRFAELRFFPGYNVQARGQRRDTGAFELGLGQRFDFGGDSPDEPTGTAGVRLEEVRFEGPPLDEDLRASVRLKTGKRVADWRVQQEAERLRARLRRRGRLDAEVSARVEGAAAVFSVDPGPLYTWRVEGLADPPDLDRPLSGALFEADALDLGREALINTLGERGHLRAEVEVTTEEAGGGREIVFAVTPGPRFAPVEVRFPGARVLSRAELLAASGGIRGLVATPDAAVTGLQEAYRARHHLGARVGAPQVDIQGTAVTVTVPIEEGPPARLVWVRPEGGTLPEDELRDALKLHTGAPFSSALVTEAVTRVRAAYLARGYTGVRVRPELVVEGTDLGLVLRVREGERRTIQSVTLSGNTRTRDWLVERALDLEEGQPVDPRRLGEAERRLLDLGTFSRSAIVPDPDNPGALTVDLREAANLSAGYDVRWDDEGGWSGLVDGLASNLLGLGVGVGGRVRYGGDFREYRGTLHLPRALATGDVTGSAFRTEEDIPADDFEIVRRQTGFQVQYGLGRPSRLETLVGYRFRRNLTLAPTLPEIPIDVGGLDVSLLRVTQNDLLDPRRGAFWSLNLNLAPSWLGSDAPLVKGFAQVALNRSFAEESFTWAQSYRLGLSWGLGGEPVIAGERFEAGGANSLRGFATNEVGPRGFFGEPTGGEAVLIMNQELRYRHHSTGLGVVGFYDVGNIFATVESMRFDLRHTLGAGLRWASPVGLLRLDVGFPLDRQPEEKSYRVFFGLGQAF